MNGRTLLSAYRSVPQYWNQYRKDLKRAAPPAPFRPNPKSWGGRGLYAAWLGHSTVLLKIDGFTVLTDPVLSLRAGINLGVGTLGPKRFVAPALTAHDLPRIDLILLSHAHMDHFDLPTLRRLESRGTTVHLPKDSGLRTRDSGLSRVTSVPGRQKST